MHLKPLASSLAIWLSLIGPFAASADENKDWAQLEKYAAANAALAPVSAGEKRVVFFGDSITQGWSIDKSFPKKPYVNRGISGQTTPQMLVRFRQDVLNLKPKVVVILAGTNEIQVLKQTNRLKGISKAYANWHVKIM